MLDLSIGSSGSSLRNAIILWAFDEMRKRAIAELSRINMNAADKVALARSYSVGDWLYEGYATLEKREVGPSSEEAERLGYETAFRLCQVREHSFRKADTNLCRSFEGLETEICETFRAELVNAGHSGSPPKRPKRIGTWGLQF